MSRHVGSGTRIAVVVVLLWLYGCGGGGGSTSVGGGSSPPVSASNATTLLVDGGPAGSINAAFATVTLCTPNASTCSTIDHVLVDTGSTGLRVLAALLPAATPLPQATLADGRPMYECIQFADGYAWGPVRTADVQIAGEQARALPVHVIGDATAPAAPADCPNGAPPQDSVMALGANGILGIGVFREDCGAACAGSAVPAGYYGCTSACAAVMVDLTRQVQNPVYRFATDNNGFQMQLPSVGAAGALGARGTLTFGLDTQANNALGTAAIVSVDPVLGSFKTLYKGTALANSYIDSGSNAYFFADASLPACTGSAAPGFYCPATVQSLAATNQSSTGNVTNVSFSVANATALVTNNPAFTAFQSLAGNNPVGSSFDWGLPFFFGRTVSFAIEGQATSAGAGPFVAY